RGGERVPAQGHAAGGTGAGRARCRVRRDGAGSARRGPPGDPGPGAGRTRADPPRGAGAGLCRTWTVQSGHWTAAVHQRGDGEEPRHPDLREARRQGPDGGGHGGHRPRDPPRPPLALARVGYCWCMRYDWLLDVILALHFGYIAFLVLGGYLAWRW